MPDSNEGSFQHDGTRSAFDIEPHQSKCFFVHSIRDVVDQSHVGGFHDIDINPVKDAVCPRHSRYQSSGGGRVLAQI